MNLVLQDALETWRGLTDEHREKVYAALDSKATELGGLAGFALWLMKAAAAERQVAARLMKRRSGNLRCKRCGGTGEVGDNDDQRCPECSS